MIKTRLTELLKIEYPIMQGGMAWVSNASLAAGVSNAGGLGIIAAGSMDGEMLRTEIRKAKEITEKPFGVNVMLMSPFAEDVAKVVVEEKVAVVTTGAGNPGKFIESWKAAGIVVIPVVPSAALALRMQRLGADAVVAEGCESGGHIGELTTMTLVPQVVDAVEIPVIAAGGIADGRTLAAAFMLGCEGVQVGTAFIVSNECTVHENYKKLILDATDTSTTVTGRRGGHPVRSIKNKLTRDCQKFEKEDISVEEFENLMTGTLRRASMDGDISGGSFMAGQIAGLVHSKATAKEIIEKMFMEAEEQLQFRFRKG